MLNVETVIKNINSNPRILEQAHDTLYHNRTYAVVNPKGEIETFYKTKRGAAGYIKREQYISYYDEMTFEMVYCGQGLEIFEIQASELKDYQTDISVWYNYIKSIYRVHRLVRNVLEEAKRYKVSNEIMDYVEKAVDEAISNYSFTIIDEFEEGQTVETEEAEETDAMTEATEKEVSENISGKITMEIVHNKEKNGIELYFNVKPSQNLRQILKDSGFRFHRKKYCWYAKKTDQHLSIVESIQSILKDTNEQINEINNEATSELNNQTQADNKAAEFENKAKHQQQDETATAEGEKVEVKSITFEWSESAYIADNTTVTTFKEAENIIKNAAHHAPNDGCYDKTKFIIEWQDSQTYTGRIDIVQNDSFKYQPLKDHIESFAKYIINDPYYDEKDRDSYKYFLNNYMLEDKQPDNPTPSDKKQNSNGRNNVIDFNLRLQQKQEKEAIQHATNVLINDIIPYIGRDELTALKDTLKAGDTDKMQLMIEKLEIIATLRKAQQDY